MSIDVVADVEQLAITGPLPSDVFSIMLDDEMMITRLIIFCLLVRSLTQTLNLTFVLSTTATSSSSSGGSSSSTRT